MIIIEMSWNICFVHVTRHHEGTLEGRRRQGRQTKKLAGRRRSGPSKAYRPCYAQQRTNLAKTLEMAPLRPSRPRDLMKTDRPCDGEYSEQLEQLRATEERNTEQLRGTEERNTEQLRGNRGKKHRTTKGNRGKEHRTT